jgi:hypothetical protein
VGDCAIDGIDLTAVSTLLAYLGRGQLRDEARAHDPISMMVWCLAVD